MIKSKQMQLSQEIWFLYTLSSISLHLLVSILILNILKEVALILNLNFYQYFRSCLFLHIFFIIFLVSMMIIVRKKQTLGWRDPQMKGCTNMIKLWVTSGDPAPSAGFCILMTNPHSHIYIHIYT